MQFLTRGFFDTLVVAVIVLGIALAAVRLYRDYTRLLPPERRPIDEPPLNEGDTRPNKPAEPNDIEENKS